MGSIQLHNGQLYIAVLGTDNLKNAQLIQHQAGGPPAVVVGQNVLQGVLHIPSMTWEDGNPIFPLVRAGWPYSGVIARIQGNKLNVGTHGPPGMKWLQATDKGLVVGCTRLVIRAAADEPYSVVAQWSSPSAVSVDAQGRVVWTDKQSGVLWRTN